MMMRSILSPLATALLAVAFLPEPLVAQNLRDKKIQGVAVLKQKESMSDDKAVLVEYTQAFAHSNVARLITPQGKALTIRQGSEVFFIPYPGRGTEEPAEHVFLTLQRMEQRFPQHRLLWKNLRIAWQNEARQEANKSESVRQAEKEEAQSKEGILSQFYSLVQSKAPLTKQTTQKEKPAKIAQDAKTPESEPSGDPFARSNLLSIDHLKPNLEKIRHYYQEAEEMSENP